MSEAASTRGNGKNGTAWTAGLLGMFVLVYFFLPLVWIGPLDVMYRRHIVSPTVMGTILAPLNFLTNHSDAYQHLMQKQTELSLRLGLVRPLQR